MVLEGSLGGGGAPGWGTPKHIPQNDPLVALIVLNTHSFLKRNFHPLGRLVPAASVGRLDWGGGVRGEKNFHVSHTYLDFPENSEHFEYTHKGQKRNPPPTEALCQPPPPPPDLMLQKIPHIWGRMWSEPHQHSCGGGGVEEGGGGGGLSGLTPGAPHARTFQL